MPGINKHAFVSAIVDDPNEALVRPSNWNADHTFNGGAVGMALQRFPGNSDGARWQYLDGIDISSLATGGVGSEGDPWTGWEAAMESFGGGSRYRFTNGVYQASRTIALPSAVEMYGSGMMASIVQFPVGVKGFTRTGAPNEKAGISIHDLTIRGTSSAPGGTLALIDISTMWHVFIERCRLYQTSTYAIRGQALANVVVDECYITNCGAAGIYFGGDTIETQFVNCFCIHSCEFNADGATAPDGHVRIHNSGYGSIRDNAFEGPNGCTYGMVLLGAQDLDISHNFFEHYSEACIVATGPTPASSSITIKANHLHSAKVPRTDISFNVGGGAHNGVIVEHNNHALNLADTRLFDPGSTISFVTRHNVAQDNGIGTTWVVGYGDDTIVDPVKDVTKGSFNPVGPPRLRFGATTHAVGASGDHMEIGSSIANSHIKLTAGGAEKGRIDSAIAAPECSLWVHDGTTLKRVKIHTVAGAVPGTALVLYVE